MRIGRHTLAFFFVASLVCSGCAGLPAAPADPAAPAPPTTAQAGGTTVVAIAPPAEACCPPPSILDFLGITQIAKAIGAARPFERLRNRLGMQFPGLESKPPVVALSDPANLESPNPAVKAAAEAKQDEDQAEQKIKAVRYLATLGCSGCYPGIEEALLAGLEDCTERVRYEAVSALRSTAGDPCASCKADACCSPAIIKVLDRIANETDDQGCYVESSERVRRNARLAMAGCGGAVAPDNQPTEGPTPADVPVANDAVASLGGGQPALGAQQYRVDQQYRPIRFGTIGNVDLSGAGLVIARVNGEAIHEREITEGVLADLGQFANVSPHQREARFQQLIRERLTSTIERKLLCQDARKHGFVLPEAGKIRQVSAVIDRDRNDQSGCSPADQQQLATTWLGHAARYERTVSADHLAAQYEVERANHQLPPRIRWEQLTVRLDRVGAPQEARQVIAYLRDRTLGVETPVPKNADLTLAETKVHDWKPVDQLDEVMMGGLLRNMPVGGVSPIQSDATGYHVVRVIEYAPSGERPLSDVADSITESLLRARRQRAERQYIAELRARSSVWSLFERDDQLGVPGGANLRTSHTAPQ